MPQIHPENWIVMYFGLIFLITFTQLVVVYVLSDASYPTLGLGLYTVYFMAALMGWIAFALQYVSNVPMTIDLPSVAFVFNSYLLYIAAGQRAEFKSGRIVLGVVCLMACLSVFFLNPQKLFGMQTAAATFFFTATGLLCAWRARKKSNVGDGIIAAAALMMVAGMPTAFYLWWANDNYSQATSVAFGVYSAAYVLVAMGFVASVLIEYQQNMSHMATEDPLTRLFNRRGLESTLHVTLAQAARQQAPTAAILVDIDHFREVNGNFGNETGDQIIRQIAQTLQRMSRSSDVVARIGGEEFLLVLPYTDLDNARVLAERIRKEISERPLVVNQQRIPTTVSLGVAGAVGDIDLDKLTHEADRAMHLAKRGGRNRVASVENKPIRMSTHVEPA